jgi:hypothetical protein
MSDVTQILSALAAGDALASDQPSLRHRQAPLGLRRA